MTRFIRQSLRIGTAAALAGFTMVLSTPPASPTHAQPLPSPSANVSVFATGLNSPRGLTFDARGDLYVSDSGTGGSNSTAGQCTQVPPPVGPYIGSSTGSGVVEFGPDGTRTIVTDGLPSSQIQPAAGGFVTGVTDVAFVGRTPYVLEAGAGCSHGVPSVPNGIFRVNPDGTTTLVANLSAFLMANPVAHPDPDDFEPDGTWYSMAAVGSDLYVTEPNQSQIDRISLGSGQISRIADLSAVPWTGPTGIAYHDGNLYTGELTGFPVVPGAARIFKVTPTGQVSVAAGGLTMVTDLAFDHQGAMYALESSTIPGMPTPGTGAVVRITPSGAPQTIATGLTFPTAMTFGPDGQLYVSNYGFGFPAGAGQVVRIPVPGSAVPELTTSAHGTSASFTVSFSNTAPGQGEVYFGPSCSGLVEVATQDLHSGTTTHTVKVVGNDLPGTVGDNGIQPGVTYAYETATVTSRGTEIDNNNGRCYSVTIPSS